MNKSLVLTAICIALLGGCVTTPPPPPFPDPSDPAAPQASTRPLRTNLVATTKVYLDPSLGQEAQKMEHGNMQSMEGMAGMQGMENKQPPAGSPTQSRDMQGTDHSNMPGMGAQQQPAPAAAQQSGAMQGMDHSKMPEMTSQPQSKEVLEKEMKQTSDEMKKLSDQLKKKSDAAKPADKSQRQPSPSPQPDHSQMQHQGTAPSNQQLSNVVYTCVMHPEVKSDKPGNCPKCGMKLVPKPATQ